MALQHLHERLCSLGHRLLTDVVALVGAVDIVPLPRHPEVGTILIVAAVIGLSLLPKSGQRGIRLSEGRYWLNLADFTWFRCSFLPLLLC